MSSSKHLENTICLSSNAPLGIHMIKIDALWGKTCDQKQLGEESVYFGLQPIIKECWERNLEAETMK